MATTQDYPTVPPGPDETEEISLEAAPGFEPTTFLPDPGGMPPGPGPRATPVPAGAEGASLLGETRTLRRTRLASAALFLASAYGVLLLWNLYIRRDESTGWLIWSLAFARFALPAAVAALLAGRARLSPGRLRAVEYALFGGVTVLLLVLEDVVTVKLVHEGDMLALVAFLKNNLIQVISLMVLYGTFIPNPPRTTARVVLSMALAPLIDMLILTEDPKLGEALRHLRAIEHVGSNALFLLIGAALAIYGAHVLNGLRTELHEARKFGQYRLLRKLGAGGMGEVYLAEHELLKRPCALKLIRPEAGADPVATARFAREVHAAAQLSHPNTVAIYDYGHTEGGTFYYVMEFLPGMGLDELVGRHGPLPAGRVIHLLRQACGALAEAHGLGLIHRDLKPANLFVARRGGESDVIKVLDFGLVKRTLEPADAGLTADRGVSGTPSYMAPEQATASDALDARADLYSLGAVAYYALTGRPPFGGTNAFAVMMAHARDPVTPPSALRPDTPADLEAVVLTCLAKAPAGRFPDARALARALAACASAGSWGPDQADRWWDEASRAAGPPARA